MWQYNYTDELYHYGVPGMRWGHRKAIQISSSSVGNARARMKQAKANKKAANKKFDKAYRDSNSWILNSQFDKKDRQNRNKALIDAAEKSAKADSQYKKAKKAYKLAKKYEKQKVKDIKAKYSKEYLSGKSKVGKAVSKLLGTDRNYANIMYDMDKHAR